MSGKFELKKASNGRFFFHLKSGNGEIILGSELYTTHAAAANGIASVRKNAPLEERYERKMARNGLPIFNLKAANHQVIGTSEGYASEAARDAGIASVKQHAPEAMLDDQSRPMEIGQPAP
jgi:uncharacterized protein YegP (UPF0339 family)